MKDKTVTKRSSVRYEIELTRQSCTECGLCEAFCPVNVFKIDKTQDNQHIVVAHPEFCWGCETCVGQCPQGALRISCDTPNDPFLNTEKASPLDQAKVKKYKTWAEALKEV